MLTKNISKFIIVLGVLSITAGLGCKDELNLPNQPIDSYTKIYMPQAVNPPTLKTFKITDDPQTITYGANYGGYDFAPQDVPITFKVNKDAVAAYNLSNGTAYPILPDDSYTLSALSTTIPKGAVATPPLNISLKTKGLGAMSA